MIAENKHNVLLKDIALTIVLALAAFFLSLNIPTYCLYDIESVFSYGLGIRRAGLLLACVYLPLLAISFKSHRISVAARCMMIVSPAFLMLFFAMAPIITFDTGHYLNYLPILNGQVGFEEWDIVRGPVFPVMINVICKLLGHSPQGLLSAQYLFLMASLYCVLVILESLESQLRVRKGFPYVLLIIVILFFCNPIFQGGFHTLLTEFPAAFVTTLTCLIAWRWMKRTGRLSVRDAGYALYFIVMSVVMWQLKQPYMGCVLYPLIVVIFCSLINKKMRENFRALFRTGVLGLSVILMLASTSAWTSFIDSFGQMDETRTTEAMTAETLVRTLPIEYLGDFSAYEAEQKFDSDLKDTETIYSVYQLSTLRNGLEEEYLTIKRNDSAGIAGSVSLLLKCWARFPLQSIEKYAINVLKISNVLAADSQEPNKPTLTLERGSGDENDAIYYKLIYGKENTFWVTEDLEAGVAVFRTDYDCARLWKAVLSFFAWFADVSFKCLNAGTIPIWMVLFVCVIRKRRTLYKNRNLLLHFVIWSYCFANLLFHAFLGAAIDRYVFTNYFVACISIALLGVACIKHERTQSVTT